MIGQMHTWMDLDGEGTMNAGGNRAKEVAGKLEGWMGEEGRMGWMRRWRSELGDELTDGRTG